MKFTVQFLVDGTSHTNGSYEGFPDAEAKCRELVEGVADCSWVELTGEPAMKSATYYARKFPEPPTEPMKAVPPPTVVQRKKKK